MPKHVLIVDEDDSFARMLGDGLVSEGFAVDRVATAKDARTILDATSPDLVLLELTLPDCDGFGVCREVASRQEHPFIIILSAKGGWDDRVRSLNLGADDYLAKPFAFEELVARMRAVMRRRASAAEYVRLGDACIDFRTRRGTRAGRDLGLSYREVAVLEYLAERAGRLVKRNDLLRAVWGYREAPLTRSVDIAIARLRRKIEIDPHRPRYIRTLHGDGYSLTPDD